MRRASIQNVVVRYRDKHRDMRREASLKDWLDWIVQPLGEIVRHHRKFVYGPVEDLVEEAIRKIAPKLLKVVAENEVDADVDEFKDGAVLGKWHADKQILANPPRPSDDVTEDYLEGYEWGYANHDSFDGRNLPPRVKREVVEDAVREFRVHMAPRMIETAARKAWKAVSPKHTLDAIIRAVKKHGWKLGVGFALFEIFEHFLLPSILVAVTGHKEYMALATLPIGEVIYAIVFRVLGRAPEGVDEFNIDGHLDWYEDTYGQVRIATEPEFPPFNQWLTVYENRTRLASGAR